MHDNTGINAFSDNSFSGDQRPTLRGNKKGQDPPTEAENTLQSNSIARLVDVLGEGPIVGLVDGGKSILIDETPLVGSDGVLNHRGVKYETRYGYPDQDYVSGFPSVETETSVDTQITQGNPIIRQINNPEADAARITIQLPALSEQQVRTGNITATSVEIMIEVRVANGDFAEVITDRIRGKTTSPYQVEYRVDLPAGGYPWDIRVSRLSEDPQSNVRNETSWTTITEVVDAKLIYPDVAYIALTADAKEFGSSVPSRAYHVRGLIISVPSNYDPETREYEGIWDGTFKQAYSDNPAWVFFDLATNDRYGAGISQVDKWELYDIGRYCDELVPDGFGGQEPRFTINTVLTEQRDVHEVLSSLAAIFRGLIYYATSALIPVADMPRDATRIYGPSNVIDGDFKYSGSSNSKRHNIIKVSYNDPENDFRQAYEVVEDPQDIQRNGIKDTSITAFGCSSRGQARRLGLWTLYTEQNSTDTIEFSVSLADADVRPGEIIRVNDPHIQQVRLSGRLQQSDTTKLILDAEPDWADGTDWTITVIMPDGENQQRTILDHDGQTVTLSDPLTDTPVHRAVYMLTAADIRPAEYRVISIEEDDNHTYKISGVMHDPSKYELVDDLIEFDEDDTISNVPTGPIDPPSNLTVETHTYHAGGTQHQGLVLSWTSSPDPRVNQYQIQHRSPAMSSYGDSQTSTQTSRDYLDVEEGEHRFRVRALDGLNRPSTWVNISKEITNLLMPVTPDDVSVDAGNFSIALRPQASRKQEYEFWRSSSELSNSQIEENALLVGEGKDITDQNLTPDTTYYYYVRAVNIYGESDWFTFSATTENNPSDIIDVISGEIRDTDLFSSLRDRIDLIDGPEDLDGSVNNRIQQVSGRVDDNVAAIETKAEISTVDDLDSALRAEYTLRVDVNGNVSGFGLAADDDQSDFSVVADRFSISHPDTGDETIPFIIQDGDTYIDSAMIADATISFAQIADDIQSQATNSNGDPLWILNKNGELITRSDDDDGGYIEQQGDRIDVYDSGQLRVRIGRLS